MPRRPRGTVSDPLTALTWPGEFAAAIGTRGLAEEVRDVLSRVAERDVDLDVLADHDPERAAQWARAGRVHRHLPRRPGRPRCR